VKQPPGPPRASEKPRQPGRVRAVFLAVLVHAAFFSLIIFGVTWQSRPNAPVQAELWDKLPPVKSKAPEREPPQPEPPRPEPPKPEPPKPEVKPEPPKPDPAIAQKLEREKREQERREKVERDKKKKEEEAKKEAVKKKREDEERRREEDRAKREAEKARAEAADARKKEFDSWVEKIRNRIRSRANVPDTVTGKPRVEVLIRILPGGEVLDVTVTSRSGNPTYDSAIERGIRSASPLPVPPASSELFPQFRELRLIVEHER
jgi:colicin import membrane protein